MSSASGSCSTSARRHPCILHRQQPGIHRSNCCGVSCGFRQRQLPHNLDRNRKHSVSVELLPAGLGRSLQTPAPQDHSYFPNVHSSCHSDRGRGSVIGLEPHPHPHPHTHSLSLCDIQLTSSDTEDGVVTQRKNQSVCATPTRNNQREERVHRVFEKNKDDVITRLHQQSLRLPFTACCNGP